MVLKIKSNIDATIRNSLIIIAVLILGVFFLPIVAFSQPSFHSENNVPLSLSSNSQTRTITVASTNSTGPKVVIINFDDSYRNQSLYAKPILDKYGFKATFFEVCGWIAKDGWEDIAVLLRDGMDVESHTMTHPYLNELSRAGLDYEIGQSKQCFLDHGINATIFAYPYGVDGGSNNSTVVNTVAKNYYLARTNTAYPLTFLHCDAWKFHPQTDCRVYSNGTNLTFANRYSINSLAYLHITGLYSYNPPGCIAICHYYNNSQMFMKFVADVNSQNPYNKDGVINAIPILVYHNIVSYPDLNYSKIPNDTTVNLFDAEMKYLHDNGFNVLTMADLGYNESDNYLYIKNSYIEQFIMRR